MSDTDLNAALDRFDVPPLSAGFTDRVLAAADGRAPAARRWAVRGGRADWGRRAGIIGGGISFGLLSAAAAATGYLGEPVREAVREAPVIGPIIARVDPPKRRPVEPKVRVAKAPASARPTAAPPPPADRRAVLVSDVKERMQRRAQERAALGLPPQRPRVQLREAIREMPIEERRALFQEYREARRERLAERWRLRQERRERWIEEQRRAAAEPPLPDEGQEQLAR